MQCKALVAIATVLVMILAAVPMGAADSTPDGNDFAAGFYWDSNTLNKDKALEIFGEEGINEMGTSMLDSMFVRDYYDWTTTLIECQLKERAAVTYATFPYEDDKDYYETEWQHIFKTTGHIKVSFTPAKESIGKSFFDLENMVVTGELKSFIENAYIGENTVLTIECDIEYIQNYVEDNTYILNDNGYYICNSSGVDEMYYMGFKNAAITVIVDDYNFEFKMDLYDETCYEYIDSYYAGDRTEEAMKKVKAGDEVLYVSTLHNTWDDWYGTITSSDGKTGEIESKADTSYIEPENVKIDSSQFVPLKTLKSWNYVYRYYFNGMGGDVEKTENFLKSNGHFEKGYEPGKYNCNLLFNEMDDKEYIDYVKDQLKSNNNTLLYAVSAIAVILLIAMIALVAMYRKKTA